MLAREIVRGGSLTVGRCRISFDGISADTRKVNLIYDLYDPRTPWLRRRATLMEVPVGASFDLPNGVTVLVASAKQKSVRLRIDNPRHLPVRQSPSKGALTCH